MAHSPQASERVRGSQGAAAVSARASRDPAAWSGGAPFKLRLRVLLAFPALGQVLREQNRNVASNRYTQGVRGWKRTPGQVWAAADPRRQDTSPDLSCEVGVSSSGPCPAQCPGEPRRSKPGEGAQTSAEREDSALCTTALPRADPGVCEVPERPLHRGEERTVTRRPRRGERPPREPGADAEQAGGGAGVPAPGLPPPSRRRGR